MKKWYLIMDKTFIGATIGARTGRPTAIGPFLSYQNLRMYALKHHGCLMPKGYRTWHGLVRRRKWHPVGSITFQRAIANHKQYNRMLQREARLRRLYE